MPGETEIHICMPGQTLNQGRVEHGSMTTTEEAEKDATRRLKANPGIEKIAYYALSDKKNGSRFFRLICTATNPNPKKPKSKSVAKKTPARAKPKSGGNVGNLKFLNKIRRVFEED